MGKHFETRPQTLTICTVHLAPFADLLISQTKILVDQEAVDDIVDSSCEGVVHDGLRMVRSSLRSLDRLKQGEMAIGLLQKPMGWKGRV